MTPRDPLPPGWHRLPCGAQVLVACGQPVVVSARSPRPPLLVMQLEIQSATGHAVRPLRADAWDDGGGSDEAMQAVYVA